MSAMEIHQKTNKNAEKQLIFIGKTNSKTSRKAKHSFVKFSQN